MPEPIAPASALCRTQGGAFVVAIEKLLPEGCTAAADDGWEEEFDFLRLTFASGAEVAGRVTRCDGKRAEIRFFGQLHPRAIEGWSRAAA